MIRDLSTCLDDQTEAADVCIIGGGIAGLVAAQRLCGLGKRVAIVESGGIRDDGSTHILNYVDNRGREYKGATLGRSRSLGGTSTRWGGALIPFLSEDLQARSYLGVGAWPIEMSELLPYVTEVEKIFDVGHTPYDETLLDTLRSNELVPRQDPDFVARFAKWPAFRNRNVASLFKGTLQNSPQLSTWVNATATCFRTDSDSGTISALAAESLSGTKLTLSAKQFIVAAGAIESTRLLLLLNRQMEETLFAGCQVLGRGLHDHVSFEGAVIETQRHRALNRLAAFRFHQNIMRSLRLELSPAAQKSERVASSFGHISVAGPPSSGMASLRALFRGLQQRGHLRLQDAFNLTRDLPYLISAGWWRLYRNQLYWPAPARYAMHIVVEQLPSHANAISLSHEVDALGTPKALVQWDIGREELRAARVFARRFDSYWRRQGLSKIGSLNWSLDPEDDQGGFPDSTDDIFHPGGTTRMGTCRSEAVVDKHLTLFAVPNLHVVSTSTFPSGASANPTLMLMAFALRLADRVGRRA